MVQQGKRVKHLYFCRHGQSKLNVLEIYAGQTDTPLTDTGRAQAKQAGKQATTLSLDLLVASPLIRAFETAQIIATEMQYPLDNIITNTLLMEQSFGSLQGQPFSVFADPAIYTDMETSEALTARATEAFAFLQSLDAETVLVVSHGSFGVALQNVIAPGSTFEELPNAAIVQLF
jgi:probable phosphoglycerate mutase